MEFDELRPGAQLGELVRILAEEQHAPAHRIARRVVAADDQEDDVAEIFARAHVPGRLAVREHGYEVGTRLRVDALVPQIHEIAEALAEHRFALLFAFDKAARLRDGRRDIRPMAQLASVLEREIEQGRQHLCGQFDRDLVNPVEGFAARQGIERRPDAAAHQGFEIGEIAGRDDWLDHLALSLVLRRVHGDEHRKLELGWPVAQGDAAEGGARRERPVLHLGVDDVLVFRHRPKRSDRAFLAIMHGRVPAQAAKIGLPDVLLVQRGIADVDLVERRLFRKCGVIHGDGRIHLASPSGYAQPRERAEDRHEIMSDHE